MRLPRLCTVLGTALALAVPATGTASAQEPIDLLPVRCGAQQVSTVPMADWRHDLGTGEQNNVPDPFGAVDTKWTVVSPAPGPAYSIAPNAAWVTSPVANWISYDRNGGGRTGGGIELPIDPTQISAPRSLQETLDAALYPISAPASMRYRTTFSLTQLHLYPSINLTYAADNGVSFYLNGTAIGGFNPPTAQVGAFNQWHTLAWAGAGFVGGTNVLEAVVTDYGVANGFIVTGGARACLAKAQAGTCVRKTDAGVVSYSPRPYDLGTGEQNHVPDPFTTVDTKWSMSTGGPAYSVVPNTAWTTSATANWINDTPTNSSGFGGLTRRFVTTFPVSAGGYNHLLSLRFAADNGVTFFLNGAPIGGFTSYTSSSFNQMHTLTWSGAGFVTGTNVLEAEVVDYGGSRGLLVEGGAAVCYDKNLPTGTGVKVLDDILRPGS